MSNRSFLGQSAIEYLMTYGWMLLVVAITGGAIFAAVGGQSTDSVSGFSGSDVLIDDFGVTSDDELGLSARNGGGSEIVVSRINVSDSDSGEWVYKEFTGDNRVSVGGEKIFELPNVTRSDGSNTLDVEITYDSGGLSNLSVSGTVSGDLELTDSGSFEGLPEDDHQPINDNGGGSEAEAFAVSYEPSGSTPYTIDVSGNDTIEVNLSGAAGNDSDTAVGGNGGYVSTSLDVSGLSEINLYVAKGNEGRNSGSTHTAGGDGGGTTAVTDSSDNLIAVADGGGGGNCGTTCGSTDIGGARGGAGYDENASGIGFGGERGPGLNEDGFPGAGEVNPEYVVDVSSGSTGYPMGADSGEIGSGDRPSDYSSSGSDNVATALSGEVFDSDQHVIGVGHGSTVHNGSAEITFNVN